MSASYVDIGLDAVAMQDDLTPAIELAALSACLGLGLLVNQTGARHDTGCPCLDCNPRLAMHPLMAMKPAEADRVIVDLGQNGPTRISMGSYPYRAPFDPELADRAQAALAYSGDHLRRMALVDRLYLDLVDANDELKHIPTCDPRSRFWIVIGALSAIPPKDITTFVRSRGEPRT